MYKVTVNAKDGFFIYLPVNIFQTPLYIKLSILKNREEAYAKWLYERFSTDLPTMYHLVKLYKLALSQGHINIKANAGYSLIEANGVADFLMKSSDVLSQLCSFFETK